MRKLIVTLSVVAVAVTSFVTNAPAASADGAQPNVVGGTPVSTKDYPFAVFLVRPGNTSNFCGGSIIAPTKILTAGHCVSDQQNTPQTPDDPATVQVVAGRDDERVATGVTANVTKIDLHPKWDGIDYDFAILTLDRALPNRAIRFANPADETKWQPGAGVTVLGWGRTSNEPGPSPLFEKASFPVVDGTSCHDFWGADDAGVDIYDPAAMICAGDATGHRDACNGDSGGPLISGNTLVGVVSFGPSPCAPAGPVTSVYAKVAAAEEWICEELGLPLTA